MPFTSFFRKNALKKVGSHRVELKLAAKRSEHIASNVTYAIPDS